jgi:hypothetical protein
VEKLKKNEVLSSFVIYCKGGISLVGELSSCQPITPYEDFVQLLSFALTLVFPFVNKGGFSFMNVCWPPKEKLKLFASIGQSQEWWLLFNKK